MNNIKQQRKKEQNYSTTVRALLKSFFPYLKPDSRLVVASLLVLAVIVVAEMAMPILLRNAVNVFASNQDNALRIMTVNRIAVQYLGIIISVLIFTFLQNYTMAIIGQRFILRVRDALFAHISGQQYAFFNTQPIGKLISRITNDVEGIQELFSQILTGLMRNIATLIGVLITMGIINARLMVFTIVALPIVIPVSMFFNRTLRRASLAVRAATAQLTGFISEHISGMHIVQIFSKTARDVAWFTKHNRFLQQKMFREIYTNAIFRPLLDILSALLIAYVFVVSGILNSGGVVSIGVVVAFLSLITRFFQQLTGIADTLLTIQSGMSGLERVSQVFKRKQQIDISQARRRHKITNGVVEFKQVGFSYIKENTVLHDINFRIHPGEMVALVGYTGSGKTTIANVLSRLWDVDSGSITIDGYDIRTIDPVELYRNVAVSGQQVALFDDSIRENIVLGKNISDDQLRQAAAMVCIDEFIQTLPDAYETHLSNGGASHLSFGQQQLITFARVIVHDPKVIILDEATSGIDSETESYLQRAIQTMLANRSALVIAHRLSTIKSANRILLLADGRVIEEGSHTELLARKGYYANLWKHQFSGKNT